MTNKILVICGPTATGKTSLGIKLAKKFNGEIVSADSKQVYKGMDIATGKDLPRNSKFEIRNPKQILNSKFQIGYYPFDGVPVWMLDLVEPEVKFTVAEYYGLAWKVIENIWSRRKLPIIVGGTGFYIKALLEGVETMGIGPDWILRDEIQNFKVLELQSYLEKINPERFKRMNNSDRNNPRRLLRAIEVELYEKRNGKKRNGETIKKDKKEFDSLFVCLNAPLEKIKQLIEIRIDKQIKSGAKKEVEGLIKEGFGFDLISMTAMGYQEWKEYFEGKITEDEVIKKWKANEYDYAKRQITWFKGQTHGIEFDITKEDWQAKVEKQVKDWYKLN